MIKVTAKLVVDLGNSETRVKTIYGKTAKGTPRSRLSLLDNRYSTISEDKVEFFLDGNSYSPGNSSIFKVENGLYYCNGELCNMEMHHTSFRPSALEKKYEAAVSRLSLINALRKGIEDVADFSNCDVNSIDIEWEIYLLLPPEDLESGAKPLSDMVKSIKTVDFIMPKLKKDIKIKAVNVLPEGVCAFFGVVYKRKNSIRPDYKYLVENGESSIIFDIGAGTTDIVMVKGSKVVHSSRFTKEVGGNNVHRLVQRSLRNRGISLPDEVVREGVNSGFVKNGSKMLDISEDISAAKNAVSNQLVDAVQEFFETSMISIRTISYILVCGGGAEASLNENIDPISNYIVRYMKKLSPNIELIKLPTVVSEAGRVTVSPRLLNIIGAGIIAE